jgi:hypothetical protein
MPFGIANTVETFIEWRVLVPQLELSSLVFHHVNRARHEFVRKLSTSFLDDTSTWHIVFLLLMSRYSRRTVALPSLNGPGGNSAVTLARRVSCSSECR